MEQFAVNAVEAIGFDEFLQIEVRRASKVFFGMRSKQVDKSFEVFRKLKV